MEYGRPRALKTEARKRLAVVLAAALVVAALFASCGPAAQKKHAADFASSLGTLDSLIASRGLDKLDAAFALAIKQAHESSDWLSLLKRARSAQAAGDVGRYSDLADRARKAFPRSEPIAAASALAYARGGRTADALALFSGVLSPDARPRLWAEAFIAAETAVPPAPATAADFARLAVITADPRPYLGAAAAALAAGDAATGRAWLEKGLALGADPPAGLLWDCGLYDALAAKNDLAAGAADLALLGDGAWMAGDSSLAKRRWERSVSLEPRRSWKPYVELALMAGDKSETADSYWARLRAAFLSGPASPARDEALVAYASHLARTGRGDEALRVLAGGGDSGTLAVVKLAIQGQSQSEGRLTAEYEALAAARPADPVVQSAALRELARRDLWSEVAVLREASARRKLPITDAWLYDAAILAARGDYPRAVAAIEAGRSRSGAGSSWRRGSGAAGPYALGSLYAALDESVKSVAAFSAATSMAEGAKERSAAFKALGRALGASGDSGGAAKAYKAAATADPSDPEAAMLARGAVIN